MFSDEEIAAAAAPIIDEINDARLPGFGVTDALWIRMHVSNLLEGSK